MCKKCPTLLSSHGFFVDKWHGHNFYPFPHFCRDSCVLDAWRRGGGGEGPRGGGGWPRDISSMGPSYRSSLSSRNNQKQNQKLAGLSQFWFASICKKTWPPGMISVWIFKGRFKSKCSLRLAKILHSKRGRMWIWKIWSALSFTLSRNYKSFFIRHQRGERKCEKKNPFRPLPLFFGERTGWNYSPSWFIIWHPQASKPCAYICVYMYARL